MKKNLITCLLCLITIISYSACSNSVENSKETKQSSQSPEKTPECSIIYDLAGGTNSPDNPEQYDSSDLPIHLKSPSKNGYLFFAWVNEDNEIISEITTVTTNPIKLKALWYKEGQAYFLVNYNLQDLEDSSKYNLIQKEYLTGKVNSKTTITERAYKGFISQNIEQQNIKSDHTTVVNINYDRNTYTVHFIVTYDDRKDISDVQISGRYQEEFTIPENQFNSDYEIEAIEPKVSNIFEDNIYYTVSMKSKYEYILYEDGVSSITLPLTIRDFRGYTQTGTGDGFITESIRDRFGEEFTIGHGHPDFEARKDDGKIVKNMVENELGEDGLPVFKQCPERYGTTKNSFYMWYRDIPEINKTFYKTLCLTKANQNTKRYEFNSPSFYPLDINEGFGKTPPYQVNGGFTDEMCFYILYNGDGRIYIKGDDDIWVFINGKLAIDLGGCHAAEQSEIYIDSETRINVFNGIEYSYKYNQKFDISEGQFVEVRIFHAERCASGSSFNLILYDLEIADRKNK